MRNEADDSLRSAVLILAACASLIVVVHFALGNGYGFHRDELQFLDDARHLQFGFVAYPPMTAFCGRIAITLFGISPGVFRLPAALVNAASLVLIGLIARELGGRRPAQIVALFAALTVTLVQSSVLQYNSFDLIAWCLVTLGTARVLRTGDERWWIGVGAGIGLGVLSKYSIAFLVAGLLSGLVILPSQRHHLRSRYFWCGALVATVIATPNLLWLATHHFITIQMEQFIHARDVRMGRANGFYTDQIKFTLFALPLALTGLVSLLRQSRFRLLSALYLGPFILLALAKGRGYYLLPAYPVLYAAGGVALERLLAKRAAWLRLACRSLVMTALLADAAAGAWAYLPMFPVDSPGWKWQMMHNEDMANEVGWPEFVAQVAAVRDTLPPEDRTRLAVLANNFGEAGALEFYGSRYGLPTPISGTNSFYARGYNPEGRTYAPETVIVTGSNLDDQLINFETCTVAARVQLPYGVHNEEDLRHPEILICRHLLRSWAEAWVQHFG